MEAMKNPSDLILSEVGDVQEIVRAACAIETAKRGAPVNPHDPSVQVRAADIILSGVGAHLRDIANDQDS
jgi:hypothetical protein